MRVDRIEPVRRAIHRSMQIERSVRRAIRAEDQPQIRQAIANSRNLGKLVAVGDDRARSAVLQAELERLLAEQREQRYRDEPSLVDGDVRDGRLMSLREQDRDAVPTSEPLRDEDVREAIREP